MSRLKRKKLKYSKNYANLCPVSATLFFNYFNQFLDSILESRGGNPKYKIVFIEPKESPQKIIQYAFASPKLLFSSSRYVNFL